MTTDKNKAIALIIPLIVKNNAGKVAIAIRDAGYSKDFIKDPELEAKLFQLYTANPDMFFEVMKNIPWNSGQIETNKPEIRDELIKLVSHHSDKEISKDNWWHELITLLAQDDSVAGETKKCCTISFGIGFLLVVAVIGILIGVVLLIRSL